MEKYIDKFNYLNHPLNIKNNETWNYNPKILNILLTDRTTNGNIKWATDDYKYLGERYSGKQEVSTFYMTKEIKKLIQPRIKKINKLRSSRRKDKGEVFTPSWICNKQNNLIDNTWFGKQNIFNTPVNKTWRTNKNKIKFPQNKTWKEYVKENRLEMACGEAPYLVSRYDAVNGKNIPVKERIGLLDRKLRIVSENTETEKEWLKWTELAYKSVYGFEFQGDSLLLARFNLLYTFIEHMYEHFGRVPNNSELEIIAEIISWNLWQMDGETYTIPFETNTKEFTQLNMFDFDNIESKTYYCLIKDWESSKTILFKDLVEGSNL